MGIRVRKWAVTPSTPSFSGINSYKWTDHLLPSWGKPPSIAGVSVAHVFLITSDYRMDKNTRTLSENDNKLTTNFSLT